MIQEDNRETVLGHVNAFRAWKIVRSENKFFLSSINDNIIWPHTEAMLGVHSSNCASKDYSNPNCGCGVYSFAEKEYLSEIGNGMVFGSVALWGTVLKHTKGYRCQYAYPQKLFH